MTFYLKNNKKKFFIYLAPMDGVTDMPFRKIVKKYSNVDFVFTEFSNVEGLCKNGYKILSQLIYDKDEHPIISQLYGYTPEFFYNATILSLELGFDGINLNFGCPVRKVVSRYAGAGIIGELDLAKKIIDFTKKGILDFKKGKRVKDIKCFSKRIVEFVSKRKPKEFSKSVSFSIKTRLSKNGVNFKDWLDFLTDIQMDMLIVHARTLEQQYTGKADWEKFYYITELLKSKNSETVFVANGDIVSSFDIEYLYNTYNLTHFMIGRGFLGKPWLFSKKHVDFDFVKNTLLEHCNMYQDFINLLLSYGFFEKSKRNFLPFRKHIGWYLKGFKNIKNVRKQIFSVTSCKDLANILDIYQKKGFYE